MFTGIFPDHYYAPRYFPGTSTAQTPPDVGGSIGRRVDLPRLPVRPSLITIHGRARMPAFSAHGVISFEVFTLMGVATGTGFGPSGLVSITPPNMRMSGIAVADPFQSISQFTITMRKRR